jgi:hypothetical protein
MDLMHTIGKTASGATTHDARFANSQCSAPDFQDTVSGNIQSGINSKDSTSLVAAFHAAYPNPFLDSLLTGM